MQSSSVHLQHRIENTIVSDTPDLILENCYSGLIESCCGMFKCDPISQIAVDMTYGQRNARATETAGFVIQ